MSECLIAVAPNGARRSREDHPEVPITPVEIARTAQACAAAGAALLHLHVRDDQGRHSLDSGRYREAIAAVRSAVGEKLVIQITTEAVGRFTPAEQIATVEDVRPEACSVALREFLASGESEDQERFCRFVGDCRAEKIWLQHILYDHTDVARFMRLREQGAIPEHGSVLLVIGRNSVSGHAEPGDLIDLLSCFGTGNLSLIDWAVCGFGVNETRVLAVSAALGGHVRVGFENSIYMPDGSLAMSNEERVSACADLIGSLGLRVMSIGVLRERLACLEGR